MLVGEFESATSPPFLLQPLGQTLYLPQPFYVLVHHLLSNFINYILCFIMYYRHWLDWVQEAIEESRAMECRSLLISVHLHKYHLLLCAATSLSTLLRCVDIWRPCNFSLTIFILFMNNFIASFTSTIFEGWCNIDESKFTMSFPNFMFWWEVLRYPVQYISQTNYFRHLCNRIRIHKLL